MPAFPPRLVEQQDAVVVMQGEVLEPARGAAYTRAKWGRGPCLSKIIHSTHGKIEIW